MSKGGRPPEDANKYIGRRYFKLTVIKSAGFEERYHENITMVEVLCDCGNKKIHPLTFVVNNRIQSCGCARGFRIRESHGLCGHPLYNVWATMKTRCYNKKHPNYKRWGAKGVMVCKEWLNDFQSFYDWCIANGWEKGLQVDKDIKARKLGLLPILYSPQRCSIVTAKENANNRIDTKIKK